jgi:iron complex outermembrane receptor protein
MRRTAFWLATAGVSALATSAFAQSAAVTGTEANELEAVVVTAAPFAVSADALTVNVEVIDRDQLDVAPAQGLGDLLSGIPGLRSTFFGPGASRPVIRGLAGPRVQVLTNGVGQIDASALSPDHQVATDPAEAKQVEVLRGPSTLLYGGSAIGGVVNIIDERIPTRRRTEGWTGGCPPGQLRGRRLASSRRGSGRVGRSCSPRRLRREADDYAVPGRESRRLTDSKARSRRTARTVETARSS